MHTATVGAQRPTILIIDDTPDNLSLVAGLLKDQYRVKVASHGEHGLKIAVSDNPPDLILLDILMPGIDGYEVCRRLKEDPKSAGIPVIFLTVKSEVADETRGFDLGAVDYITKPVSPPILLARVKAQLNLKKAANFLKNANVTLEAQVQQRTRQNAESESRFRAIAEQAIVGIYTLDGSVITYMNPRAASIFGYSVEEAIGRPARDFFSATDWVRGQENMRRRLEGEIESVQYEFEGRRKDGSSVMIGVHGAVATIDGRRVITGVLQDITDKLRAEAEIRNYFAKVERMVVGTVNTVSTLVELRDPYTAGHERRVAALAVAIAAEMGWTEQRQFGLRLAAAVHDVGKIVVPAEILAKPTHLTQTELELMKSHAEGGHEVLQGIESPWPLAQVALQHHERMDGSGYPNGLKGGQIIPEARIVAVADTVEAMASHRPYRAGLGIDAALREIEQNRGTLYDEQVVDACLRLFREKSFQLPE